MTLNAGIILGGQSPNILGAMNEGRAMAESQIAMNRQNALAELYRTQGAGIAAGDQNALNALAGMDPMASLGVQDARLGMDQTRLGMDATRLGMDATRQDMQFSAEKMAMLREESKREAAAALAEQAATLSAEQLAAEQAALSDALSGGAFYYQNKDKAGYDNFLTSKGIDPAEFPFEAFPAHAAAVEGVLEAYKTFAPPEAPKPTADMLEFQYAQKNPEFAQYQADQKKAGAATTTVNTTVGAAGDGSTRPGQVFDEMKASTESARAAVTGLRALREAEAALQGGAITGFAADQRLAAAKLGALMGVTDPAIIQNTETFRSAIAPQVAAMLKATVGSAQISNSDREFAEKAAGGSIALDESTIRRLLGIMEKAALASVESHNRRLDAVYPEGSGADRERALFGVNAPADIPADVPAPTETKPKRLKYNPATGELE